MIAVLCLSLLVTGSLACAQEDTPPTMIANVYIIGNRKIPTDRMLQYIRTKPGCAYSYAQLQDDVQRLAESRLFRRILPVKTETIADGRVNIFFEVAEHRNTVREVIFRNAGRFELKELLDVAGVRPGQPLDADANTAACWDLQDFLKRHGYHFAEVSLREGQKESDERVVFDISTGPKVRVRDVRFSGHGAWTSAEKLAAQIETHQAFPRGWGEIFQPEIIQSDVAKLIDHYRDNGSFKADVESQLCWCKDFQYVDVVFRIKEGKRYRVGDWALEGDFDKLPRAQMERLIRLRKREFYSAETVRADVQSLADWGGRRGKRLDVRSFHFEVPDQPGMVHVGYEVEDAPVLRVGEIIIVGNTVTRDDVIRKQVKLFPGQLLDYTQVRASEKNLRDLGIFRVDPEAGIAPTVTVLDGQGEFRDILVKVQETRTGSLMIGIGLSSEGEPFISVVLKERNLDVRRWPTSWADVRNGQAFRGAGQKLHVQLLPWFRVLP